MLEGPEERPHGDPFVHHEARGLLAAGDGLREDVHILSREPAGPELVRQIARQRGDLAVATWPWPAAVRKPIAVR